jgi:Kef-type K+ transport system membrane component KefB
MLLEIAITLVMARILNYIFEKYHQPGVVGEILAGIILGPCCIGYFSGSSVNIFGTTLFEFNLNLNSPEFKELAFIGIIFLLFIIGLDTNISDLKRTGKSAMLVAVFGIIIPFLFGFVIGLIFNLNVLICMAIGAIFFSSSLTISIRTLSDLGLLSSRIGLTLQGAGIISDIIGLFIFSLILGQGHPFVYILKIIIFLIFIIVGGIFIVKYTIKKKASRQSAMLVLPVGLVSCFLFAAFAEDMGLAAIIGAFAAGLMIKKTPYGGMITNYTKTIAQSLFIPLFFVWVGASFNFFNIFISQQIIPQIIFIFLFVILGLFGNFIGGSIGARLSGINTRDSLSIGAGMIPVMGIALVILSSSIERGVFGSPTGILAHQIKNATLILIIVSCIITPHMIRRSIRSPFQKKNKLELNKSINKFINENVTDKILNKPENSLSWEKEFLLIKIFVIAVFLQFAFLMINKTYIYYLVPGFVASIIGTYIGFITLKYILQKKSKINFD